MPWYTLIPPYAGHALNGHAWVPMDDENCMAWSMTFHPTAPIPEKDVELIKDGNGVHAELIPGSFRPVANRDNDYLIDRAKQKSGRHYNGVRGLAMQDASVQESIGVIADRTRESRIHRQRHHPARASGSPGGEGGARGARRRGSTRMRNWCAPPPSSFRPPPVSRSAPSTP